MFCKWNSEDLHLKYYLRDFLMEMNINTFLMLGVLAT